ncbi:MAG: hypothetical protein CMJ83_14570 [Planctomycetes bacterium]|nr:hypothetical protein [Planctomycetota bacterium]
MACAAAVATLEIIRRDRLPACATELGAWALDRLRSLDHARIREVRGRGLMIAIELKERSAPFQRALQERGVLVLGAGPTALRLLPPLVITRDELGQVIDAIDEVLAS